MASWFKRGPPPQQNPPPESTAENAPSSSSAPPPSSSSSSSSSSPSPSPSSANKFIGSLFSGVTHVASKIITTIQEESTKFLNEQESPDTAEVVANDVPLWLNLHSDDPRVAEEARTAIIGLTKSKRNFLNAPPDDANFLFDYKASMGSAAAALKADANLNMARFYLVPIYIKEEDFWRNWFYRVQIILSAYGLEMPKGGKQQTSSNTTSTSTSTSSKPSPTTDANTAIFVEGDYLNKDIEKELGALGIHTGESNPDAWEEELKRELSELDAAKEGGSGTSALLSQNWEEELMLELGLKDKDSTASSTTGDTPTSTTTDAYSTATNNTTPTSSTSSTTDTTTTTTTTTISDTLNADQPPLTSLPPQDSSVITPTPPAPTSTPPTVSTTTSDTQEHKFDEASVP